MKVTNLTKNTLIASDLKMAVSFSDKFFGLLKKSNPRCLMFQTRFGIHTFGLKEPIDVLILNSDQRVVKLRRNMLPNRFFFWNPSYFTVIELPTGMIARAKVSLGDKISFC